MAEISQEYDKQEIRRLIDDNNVSGTIQLLIDVLSAEDQQDRWYSVIGSVDCGLENAREAALDTEKEIKAASIE